MSCKTDRTSPLDSNRDWCYWIALNTFLKDCESSLLRCIYGDLLYSDLSSLLPFISTSHLIISSAFVFKSLILHVFISWLIPFIYVPLTSLSSLTEAPGFVTLDHSLRYYPSITYGVIGSAIIFVLVVALLALVLHHQRKRTVLLTRNVRGNTNHHQPLLLSRLVILDRGHVHAGGPGLSSGSSNPTGQYSSSPQALHLLSGTVYPSSVSLDLPPSYSESVLDVRYHV